MSPVAKVTQRWIFKNETPVIVVNMMQLFWNYPKAPICVLSEFWPRVSDFLNNIFPKYLVDFASIFFCVVTLNLNYNFFKLAWFHIFSGKICPFCYFLEFQRSLECHFIWLWRTYLIMQMSSVNEIAIFDKILEVVQSLMSSS